MRTADRHPVRGRVSRRGLLCGGGVIDPIENHQAASGFRFDGGLEFLDGLLRTVFAWLRREAVADGRNRCYAPALSYAAVGQHR